MLDVLSFVQEAVGCRRGMNPSIQEQAGQEGRYPAVLSQQVRLIRVRTW